MSGRVIKDDEEYDRAEFQKFKMASELDDPLNEVLPADRKRLMAIYDRTCEMLVKYRRGRLVQEFPGLRDQYGINGWEFQEFDDPTQSTEPEPVVEDQANPLTPEPIHVPEPEPPQEPIKKPAANLMSWLDD